jgi:hypothetical protein
MTDKDHADGGELLVRTWSDTEAAMIRQILASYGIPCQVVSDITHTVYPITVDGLGEVRILVPAARLDEARELLAEHRRQGLEIVDGGKDEDDDDHGADEPELTGR